MRPLGRGLNQKLSPGTLNLDVILLNAVLKHAVGEKWIKVLPTQNMRPLKCSTKKRELFSVADLEKLCQAAMDRKADGSPVTKNRQQFCD